VRSALSANYQFYNATHRHSHNFQLHTSCLSINNPHRSSLVPLHSILLRFFPLLSTSLPPSPGLAVNNTLVSQKPERKPCQNKNSLARTLQETTMEYVEKTQAPPPRTFAHRKSLQASQELSNRKKLANLTLFFGVLQEFRIHFSTERNQHLYITILPI
jgi:hypothetical protein